MGNEVSKKYNLSEEHNATAGHCQLWKIYPGHVVHKDKVTTTDVSVWLFMRDGLAKREPVPITDKSTQEQIMQIMKKDMACMKEKEMQHRGIVKILEVAEDSRKGMAFVTERIVCSLADLLSRFENIPGRYNWHANYLEANATITDVEISHGFLQIAEALQYLHSVRKKLHMNVSPENIVLTPGGEWKLCGLGFSLSFANDDNKIAIPYYLSPVATKSMLLEPDLKYMGQEMTEAGGTLRYAFASSDLFSLGVTMYETYRFNLQLARAGRSNVSIINVSNNNVEDHYHRALKDLERLDYSMIPQGVQQILRGMLQLPAHGRVGNIDIINNPFFHSGALAIMRNLSTIASKDQGGQASTLSSLPSQICDFPPRLLENYVLPVICKLGCKDPSMWKYSLPLYVFISSKISAPAYARAATSSLITGLNETGSADSLAAFVAHTEHLLQALSKDFFSKYVVKMLCNALDKQGESALQGSAISVLTKDFICNAISSEQFLDEVVPKVCRETCKNPNFEVKLKGLYFLSVVAKRFEPAFVSKNILPSLKHVLSQECTSDMTMAVLGVYNAVLPAVSADLLASNVLPAVTPILTNRALNRDQFQLATNRITFFLQTLLTFRTNELGVPAITVTSNEAMKGHFFKEQLTSSTSSSSSTPLVPATPPPVPNAGGFGLSSGNSKGGSIKSPPAAPSAAPPVPPVPTSKAPPPVPPKPSPPPPVPTSSSGSASSSSWFGGSSSSSSGSNNSTSGGGGGYVAPSMPSTPPPVPSSTPQGGMGMGMGGGMGGGMADNSGSFDMDDFMTSFSKSASTTSSTAPPPETKTANSGRQGSKISPPPPVPGSSSGAGLFSGMSSSSSVSSGSSTGGGSIGGNSVGGSIEDQIRSTQAEIARLSGSMGGAQQQPGMDFFGGSGGMHAQQSNQMYQQPNQMQQSNNFFQQQQQPNMGMNSMGNNMGMNGMGGMGGQSNMQQYNYSNNSNMGGMGMGGGSMGGGFNNNSNMAPYSASGGSGYQPPNSNNMGGMNNNNGGAKKDDPFDFFN